MVSKAISALILAGCLLVANANTRVLLQQPSTGMQTTTMQQPGAMQTAAGSQLRVEAPASEEMLSNFDLYLTPSQETMSDSQMLMQTFSNPDQFKNWVNERIQLPDGITVVAAVFSDLMSRGQAQQLAMALNQAFGMQQQQGISAQTGSSGQQQYNPAFTAWTLAIIDQISRRDVQRAGEAMYWALSGAGGQDLASRTLVALDSMQAQIGCTDPLKTAFQFAGQFANMQMTSPQQPMGTPGQQQSSPSTFVTWVSQSPSLMACFQNAYPNFQMLQQQSQQGGMAGGAAGTQQPGATGMAGQG